MTSKWGMGAVVVAVVVAFALAGCTTGTPTALPTTSAAPTETATPMLPPTPTPTPLTTITPLPPSRPTLYQLVLSPDGLGDLVMGQPVPTEDPASATVTFNDDLCSQYTTERITGWEVSYPNGPFAITTESQSRTGAVSLIEISSPKISTYNAVHIGSTRAQILAGYDKPDRIIRGLSTDLYVIDGSHGQLVFEVARQVTFGAQKTPYWKASQVNTVQLITVWPKSATPRSLYGTDGIGGCA